MKDAKMFVEGEHGEWINLTQVAVAKPAHSRWPERRFQLFGANDQSLGVVQCDHPAAVFVAVVAAAPDAVAAAIHCIAVDSDRPTESWAEMLHVIAWRLSGEYASPMFADCVLESTPVVIRSPDGRWFRPDCTSYASLDDAKRGVLAEAQRAWDRKHGAAV